VNVANRFRTLETDQPSRPNPVKLVAKKNMEDIPVAEATFHPDRSALKFDASRNMSSKSVTLLTSHWFTPFPVNAVAPSKAKAMVVTLDVSQPDTS